MFDLLQHRFENGLGAIQNWGRWSDIIAAICPDIVPQESTSERMLPIRCC